MQNYTENMVAATDGGEWGGGGLAPNFSTSISRPNEPNEVQKFQFQTEILLFTDVQKLYEP